MRVTSTFIAIALGAAGCSLGTKQISGTSPPVEAALTPDETALLSELENTRAHALQTVQWLVDEGDADHFLGQSAFCGSSAFLCSQLAALNADKKTFLQQQFLNADAYTRELGALRAAKFSTTSDPSQVLLESGVKTAKASAATQQIVFFFPTVRALPEAERVALLLHEIWHLLGLPDENAFGPFTLTQDAINASAASETVLWNARTNSLTAMFSFLSLWTPWPGMLLSDFPALTPQSCATTSTAYAWIVPDTCRIQFRQPKRSSFHVVFDPYLAQTGSFTMTAVDPTKASKASFRFRIDDSGRYYAMEVARAAGRLTGASLTQQIVYFDGHDTAVLFSPPAAYGFEAIVHGDSIYVPTATFTTVLAKGALKNYAGTFELDLENQQLKSLPVTFLFQ